MKIFSFLLVFFSKDQLHPWYWVLTTISLETIFGKSHDWMNYQAPTFIEKPKSKIEIHTQHEPKSALLKKNIHGFNIRHEHHTTNTYTAFPQSGITIGFFENSRIDYNGQEITIRSDLNGQDRIVFLSKFLSPINIHYTGRTNKISIHFKEGCVCSFFPNYFAQFHGSLLLTKSLAELEIVSSKLFSRDINESLNYLEEYLISCFAHNVDQSTLNQLDLVRERIHLPTADLAHMLCLTPRTFRRQFKSSIGCSISEFKRLCRFHKSLQKLHRNAKSLTEICYECGYYDSSHFYREILHFTGLTPKDFFSKAQDLNSPNYIYSAD